MPTRLKYLLMVSFCLMTLIPMLAGSFAAMLVMQGARERGEPYLFSISLIGFLSFLIASFGFVAVKQLLMPLVQVKNAAQDIAAGRFETDPEVQSSTDEIQDLTRSLQKISKNARELLEKVERLSVKDKLTGLYNAAYIRERLDEEIQRAIHYQRPCSFAYLVIRNFEDYASRYGDGLTEDALKKIASTVNGNMREFDRAARVGRGEFVIILPDQNKKKGIELIDKIEKGVAALQLTTPDGEPLTLCAGVSENPIDGVDAQSLFIKALERMKLAQTQGKPLEAFA